MSSLIFTKSPYLGKTDPDCIVVAFDKSSGLKAYFEQTPEQAIAFGCALIKEAERALAETRADERAQEIALQVLAIVRQPAAVLAEATADRWFELNKAAICERVEDDKPDPDEAREQKLDEALDRAWSDEP